MSVFSGGQKMKLSIRSRILLSFLLLTTTSLSILGAYLLNFFYQNNLETTTKHLITNARIIEATLENTLYKPDKQSILQSEIEKISALTNLRITILDLSGKVLTDSWEPANTLDNHLDRKEIQAAFTHDYATSIRYSSTIAQNMLYVAVPIYNDNDIVGIARIASTLAPIEASYQQIRIIILSAILVTILLTIIVGIALSHRQIQPIKAMIATAKHIANGQLGCRIHIKTNDEFEILAHTINQLTSNLEDKINEINAEAKKSALILENMDNAVFLLDSYGNITATNASANELFQITPDLIGRHSISVLGDSLLSQTAQEVLISQHSKSISLKLKVNHTVKTFQVFFAPIIQHDNTISDILSVFHDISMLQEIYDRQIDFVTNASHELSTPLTSIRGYTETLLDGALESSDLSRKFLNIIHAESERMTRLVKDLLQLAKLDNKDYRNQIRLESVNINAIITALEAKLSIPIANKQQSLIISLPDTAVIIQANYDWIMQLMINITENAIKYTPSSGVIKIAAFQEESSAYIIIADSGVGIAPQDIPLIFDRFYRADKSRTRTAGGSGIGLSLARFIVELFGGKITVTSQLNIGSTFTISLPLKQDK